MISQENVLHRKRDLDRSKAGGEIIIAGLAVVALAAIVCYIRVTRQKNEESKLPLSVWVHAQVRLGFGIGILARFGDAYLGVSVVQIKLYHM